VAARQKRDEREPHRFALAFDDALNRRMKLRDRLGGGHQCVRLTLALVRRL
jgi:hypothetical protein